MAFWPDFDGFWQGEGGFLDVATGEMVTFDQFLNGEGVQCLPWEEISLRSEVGFRILCPEPGWRIAGPETGVGRAAGGRRRLAGQETGLMFAILTKGSAHPKVVREI